MMQSVFLVSTYTAFMTSEADLLTPLRRYWGYNSFRPLQERIVRSLQLYKINATAVAAITSTNSCRNACSPAHADLKPAME